MDDSCDIDGVYCTIQELGTGAARAKGCDDCGYADWAPDDVKFIIEHDTFREHLCPCCAIERGLGEEYFHKNENDPRSCPGTPAFDANKCSTRNCPVVGGVTQHTVGKFTTSSLLEAIDKERGEKVMVCPTCWIRSAVVQARKTCDKYEDRPEDVLDKVLYSCSVRNVKPAGGEKGGSKEESGSPNEESAGGTGGKRSLGDAAEDDIASKKQRS